MITRKTTGVLVLTTCLVCNMFNAFCGTITYSFDWYRNATQTDFQIPLVLEERHNRFTYSTTAANGADICVTDAGGTALPIEIENWNPSGKSIVWVKVPSFSNATILTLLWGEESSGISKPDENLWGDAKLVMHLANGADSSSFCSEFTRTEDTTEDGPVGSACVFGTVDRRYGCSAMNKDQVGALTNCFGSSRLFVRRSA